jgi:hypothetical protein
MDGRNILVCWCNWKRNSTYDSPDGRSQNLLGLAVVVRYKTHPMDGRWHLAGIDVSRSEKNHNR